MYRRETPLATANKLELTTSRSNVTVRFQNAIGVLITISHARILATRGRSSAKTQGVSSLDIKGPLVDNLF